MTDERRDSRRIIVGPDHTVRFLAKGHAFHNVRITNLSLGGCFATVRNNDSTLFHLGTLLERFTFEHSALCHSPFTARVTFILGGPHQRMEFLGLGIQFLEPPTDVWTSLRAFIEAYPRELIR